MSEESFSTDCCCCGKQAVEGEMNTCFTISVRESHDDNEFDVFRFVVCQSCRQLIRFRWDDANTPSEFRGKE